jgi:hypothetical protein
MEKVQKFFHSKQKYVISGEFIYQQRLSWTRDDVCLHQKSVEPSWTPDC